MEGIRPTSEFMDIDPDEVVLDYDPINGVARTGSHQESINSRWNMPPLARQVAGTIVALEAKRMAIEEQVDI